MKSNLTLYVFPNAGQYGMAKNGAGDPLNEIRHGLTATLMAQNKI